MARTGAFSFTTTGTCWSHYWANWENGGHGDGWNNAQEFVAGTLPTDASSVLKVTLAVTGADITVSFPGVVGKTYRLESSDTLQSGSWTTRQDNLAGTGVIIEITDTGGALPTKRFYRVVVQ